MASTPTDPPTEGAGAAVRPPAPLDAAAAARVPGTLGKIGLERLEAYAEAPLPASPGAGRPGRLRAALAQRGLQVIAEVKRASPSQGPIAELEPVAAARAYAAGGAAAISVLTEERHFGGELAHARDVAAAVPLPVLRKDFTVHPAMVREAADAGAAAVLLIVALLGERTGEYLAYARASGVDALVEVHDEEELELALAAGADLIGVNNRDLATLEIDLATAPRLLRLARERGHEGLLVAESGYRTAADLGSVAGLADGVLVGTSLAGSGDLAAALRSLREGA